MGHHGRSIFWAVVYFMDLSICAKFQRHSLRASYLSQGSLMKMPSEKYASGGILGLVYLDEWARYSRSGFSERYYHTSTTIVPSFVCIADTVALRVRQLERNRHIVAWSAKLLKPSDARDRASLRPCRETARCYVVQRDRAKLRGK